MDDRRVGDRPASAGYAEALRRELTSAVAGEVRFGVAGRAWYGFAASIYRQGPVGVVAPPDNADAEPAPESRHSGPRRACGFRARRTAARARR
jgi:hypothetical protein